MHRFWNAQADAAGKPCRRHQSEVVMDVRRVPNDARTYRYPIMVQLYKFMPRLG